MLAILFAGFISLFTLDVFLEDAALWDKLLGFAIHLVPTYVVVISLLIAWRRERLGGVLFLALGAASITMFWEHSHWQAYLMLSGPLIVVGSLFLLHASRDRMAEKSR
jgi:hypothetical protein